MSISICRVNDILRLSPVSVYGQHPWNWTIPMIVYGLGPVHVTVCTPELGREGIKGHRRHD